MPKASPILIWTVGAVIVLSICKTPARDLGQWDGVDPLHRQWFNGLKQPDNPILSCCGEAKAILGGFDWGARTANIVAAL